MGATAAVLLGGGPSIAAYALAAVAATAVTITRPVQAVLMPSLARTPEELTAANVASGWIESLSILGAPALAGVLLGAGGAGTVFAVMAGVALAAAVLVAPVRGPAAAGAGNPVADTLDGLAVVAREPGPRALVWLLGSRIARDRRLRRALRRARRRGSAPRRRDSGLPERRVRRGRRARRRWSPWRSSGVAGSRPRC